MRIPRPRITLTAKIFLSLAGFAFLVAFAGNAMLYVGASKALHDEVRTNLESIASTVATQIDVSEHATLRVRTDEQSNAYTHIKSQLASAKRANKDIRFIYTMRPDPNPKEWHFVVDAESDPNLVSHTGDEYDTSRFPAMQKALTGPSADPAACKDEWGWYLSAYAPVRASNGRTEAIVGVDMSMAQVRAEEAGLRRSALLNTIVSLLLAIALAFLATGYTAKLIHRFTCAAQRAQAGDLDFQVPLSGPREIHDFTVVFNEMISGLREGRQRLIEGSAIDFLTGLYNHMHMHERLETEVQRAGRYGHKLCVLMIDLDRFKSINDTLGHPIGDSLLLQLSSVMRNILRDIDILARYGGDEFMAILPETDLETGLAVAERLRSVVESHLFQVVPVSALGPDQSTAQDGDGMHITVTIGLACYPDHHDSKDGIIMSADIALCQAKHVARNSVFVYEKSDETNDVDPHRLYQLIHDPNGAAVASLSAAVGVKDKYTSGHSERVARLSQMIAQATGADTHLLDTLGIAGLLHDVGKIGIPDSVLNKMGGLTLEERDKMRKHASLGAEILKRAPHLDEIIPAVVHHHERWDGTGYPDGLSGESIPLMARIMAIADAFDAMTSDRSYRRAMTVEAAITELRICAGKQFDPVLVEAFISSLSGYAPKAA